MKNFSLFLFSHCFQTKLDSLQGADHEALEARIRQHYGDGDSEEVEDCGVPGHVSRIFGLCNWILKDFMSACSVKHSRIL